jgi:hypothetical protein
MAVPLGAVTWAIHGAGPVVAAAVYPVHGRLSGLERVDSAGRGSEDHIRGRPGPAGAE